MDPQLVVHICSGLKHTSDQLRRGLLCQLIPSLKFSLSCSIESLNTKKIKLPKSKVAGRTSAVQPLRNNR